MHPQIKKVRYLKNKLNFQINYVTLTQNLETKFLRKAAILVLCGLNFDSTYYVFSILNFYFSVFVVFLSAGI
jgi:hypothetical protein